MNITVAEDIRHRLRRRLNDGQPHDLDDLYACIAAQDGLIDPDTDWRHDVRAVIQRLKADGTIVHVGYGRYQTQRNEQ